MVEETGLYDSLGVPPSASQSQLKTAYKKGALRFHPDKNPGNPDAEHKFKELSRAYEILSDPERREIYDELGEDGLEQSGPADFRPQDIFSQLFGEGPPRQRGPPKANPIQQYIRVTLSDIYKGIKIDLPITRNVRCSGCRGKGGKDPRQCPACGGMGKRAQMHQIAMMLQQVVVPCEPCGGSGVMLRPKDRCKVCNGMRSLKQEEKLQVPVERGVEDLYVMTFAGKGEWVAGSMTGDILCQIRTKQHERFQRQGDDLHVKVNIDLATSLLGGDVYIEHLDGRWLSVHIQPGEYISTGTVKIVPKQGMPVWEKTDQYGDLYIQFVVIFPTSDKLGQFATQKFAFTPDQIKALQEILPPRVDTLPNAAKLMEDSRATLFDKDGKPTLDQDNKEQKVQVSLFQIPPPDASIKQCVMEEPPQEDESMMDFDEATEAGAGAGGPGKVQCSST